MSMIKYLFYSACLSGWTSYGHTGQCYQHFTSLKPWDEARRFCQSAAPDGKEGDLASVGDHFTNSFLTTITTKYVWIGGQRNEDENWSWTDGSRFRYNAWAPEQPNDAEQKHIAFNFGTPGQWNDEHVNSEKGFICQYKGNEFLSLF